MRMKQLIDHFAAYDSWANARFVDRLLQEPDEVLDRQVPGSFPSLRATLLHIRDAEHVWYCRLTGTRHSWPASADMDLRSVLAHGQLFHDHVLGLDEEALEVVHDYTDLKGNVHRQPAWQMIMHCCNHSTQHRGQLITMMRTLELSRIPANDMVVFQRSLVA
jgi:uncharacterized damage-inducible protein DinB